MSIEVIVAIAALCQATGSGDMLNIEAGPRADKRQHACQVEYLACWETESGGPGERISKCIKKRVFK